MNHLFRSAHAPIAISFFVSINTDDDFLSMFSLFSNFLQTSFNLFLLQRQDYFQICIDRMFVVPTILITTPLFDNDDDCSLPSITVTRDNMVETDNTRTAPAPASDQQTSIFPQRLFDAARYVN